MTTVGYLMIGIVVLLAGGMVGWHYRKTRCVIKRMNQMLDEAIEGTFSEKCFDESLISALEARFARYLAACATSEKNLQAERDKIKTLIADISHQTKTPIANILLYTQLLGEQELAPESQTCISALEGQAQKLQSLIDVLVKTSRLENGIITLHPVSGKLDAVLQSAASQLLPKAEAKNINLKVEANGAEAVYDPKWTEEAVFNLLDNAVKYTPVGGSISVSTQMYQLFTCIRVADTGPGIPEEEQPKVFLRFYRGAAHQAKEGVGIGLYLVRQIAEGQGGYVKVGKAENGGAVFSMYLLRNE